jgi:hypothetical protein
MTAVGRERRIYPRRTEARIEDIEHLDPVIKQTQQRVQQILRDIPAADVQDGPATGSPPIRSETNRTWLTPGDLGQLGETGFDWYVGTNMIFHQAGEE